MNCTPGERNGEAVVVYCAEDNPLQTFVIALDEFKHKYEEVDNGK